MEKRKWERGQEGPVVAVGHRGCGVGIRGGPGALGGAVGAPPDLCPAHTEVFQEMAKYECHFINGTEKVRFVDRYIYNREEFTRFDSDVGWYVGFTPYGERVAQYLNSDSEYMENRRAEVNRYCRHNYQLDAPFSMERRGERGAERVPSGPALAMTLEPL